VPDSCEICHTIDLGKFLVSCGYEYVVLSVRELYVVRALNLSDGKYGYCHKVPGVLSSTD
jgi:hypothetical protein